jgi:hypothetical protein
MASRWLILSPVYSAMNSSFAKRLVAKHPNPSMGEFMIANPRASFSLRQEASGLKGSSARRLFMSEKRIREQLFCYV